MEHYFKKLDSFCEKKLNFAAWLMFSANQQILRFGSKLCRLRKTVLRNYHMCETKWQT